MTTFFLKHALVLASLTGTLACSGPDAEDTSASTGDAQVAPADDRSLDRFSGTWEVRATSQAGDSLPTHLLTATADTSGWSVTFPDRPAVPVHVIDRAGDLVVFETAPYESVLRPGVRVTVFFVTRAQGDLLTGSLIAHYDVAGSTAILRGTLEGSRQP